MTRFLTGAILAAALIGATPAHAIVPAIPPPAYTDQEVADFKAKAQAGDAAAQSTLGRAYMYGLRIGKDVPEGLRLLNLAAAQNDGAAEEALGDAYLSGNGVTASKPAALDWFRRAVADGQSSATGWANQLGQAHDYYLKLQAAAQTGDAAAQYAFAAFMPPEHPGYGGHGWGDDDAIKWYKLSAKQGYAPAEAWLGFYYLMGYVRDKSGQAAPHAAWEADEFKTGQINIAVDWYEKAAAQGDDEAIHVLPAVYVMSLIKSPEQIEAAIRASAWRPLPPAPSRDTLAELKNGHYRDDMAIDAERQHIFNDLRQLCAWYDGQALAWQDNHLTDDAQIITGWPRPDRALDCYRHEGDIGLPGGAYVAAYRTSHAAKPDLVEAEKDYRRVWDLFTDNAGLATRAAAHIGLMARDRGDRAAAYAWLTMAVRGDMTVFGENGAGVDEPDLADRAAAALKALKLTPAQKAEGDAQLTGLLRSHPPAPPPPPPPHMVMY